jgi:small subunit ribosomal protein S17
MTAEQTKKKRLIGIVKSDKMQKSRRVEVERLYKHPKYSKILRSRIVCHVHDEQNDSKAGDTVEIVECRPRSRTKRWELLRIVERGLDVSRSAGTESVES